MPAIDFQSCDRVSVGSPVGTDWIAEPRRTPSDYYSRQFDGRIPAQYLMLSSHAQASTSVRHLVLPCHWSQRSTVSADLVRCYGALGRTIIFCDTKRDCNELVASLGEGMRAQPLHGDIPQQQREVSNGFSHLPSSLSSSCQGRTVLVTLSAHEPGLFHASLS